MRKKSCSKCGSPDLSFGKFDSKNGTPVKCNECGNVSIMNNQEYYELSTGNPEEEE